MKTYRARALALAVALLAGSFALFHQTASAHIVPGQYSLGLSATEASGTITLDISIDYDVAAMGKYQAVEWNVDYPEDLVSAGNIVAGPNAPASCQYAKDNGTYLLVGCIDPSGNADNLDFSGVAYVATLYCVKPGDVTIRIASVQGIDPDPDSFVATTQGNPPVHTHDATVTCGAASPQATPAPTLPPEARETAIAEATTAAVANQTVIAATPGAVETAGAARTAAAASDTPGASGTARASGTPGASRTAQKDVDQGAFSSGTPRAGSTVANSAQSSDKKNDGGGFPAWGIALIVVGAVAVVGGGAFGLRAMRGPR